jgi:hypothetical protein
MKIPIYQIDAFTSEIFSGNPAAVCILDTWINDEQLLNLLPQRTICQRQPSSSGIMMDLTSDGLHPLQKSLYADTRH